MSSPILWGPTGANNLQDSLGFANGTGPAVLAPAVPVNPTVTAVSASKGSLYLGNGAIYVKQDAGLTTNWLAMGTGSIVTNWTAYTPTLSAAWGSATTSLRYRRMGDTIGVSGTIIAGTTGSGNGTISLPSGLSVDLIKFSSSANYTQYLGRAQRMVSSLVANVNQNTISVSFVLALDSTSPTGVYVSFNTASNTFNAEPLNTIISSGDTIYVEFSVPIVGWSSADAIITPATVVAAQLTLATTATVGASSIIKYDTVQFDTAGAYSTTTGLYTVPAQGAYQVEVVSFCSGGTNVLVYKNGTAYSYIVTSQSGTINSGSVLVPCVAGDTLGIYLDTGSANVYGSSSPLYTSLSIFRIAPQAVLSGARITRVVSSISSPTTLGAAASTDYVALVSGTTTVTLPTAVGNTNLYRIKNSGVATVTIATTSAQTIDGSATASLPVPNTSLSIISDGSNWRIT